MENLDIDGLFWLPSNPERKVAGRLTFDAANLGQLDLIGSFHELPSSGTMTQLGTPDWNKRFRIHGVAGTRLLALDRCMQVQGKLEVPGVRRERYYAPLVLSGKYYGEEEPLEFSSVSVQLRHLEHWVNKTGVELWVEPWEDPKEAKAFGLTYTPLESLVATTSICDLELRFCGKLIKDYLIQNTIEQRCSLILRFPRPCPLRSVLQLCSALQDIVTIGAFAPSRFTCLRLGVPESNADAFPLSMEQSQVQLYAGLGGSNLPEMKESPIIHSMLFAFDEIGGIDGVAKWIEQTDRLGIVLSALMNYWYVPAQTEESKFFNVIAAAEALARIRTQRQNINFKREIKSLACSAGNAFKALVGDVNCWTNEIVRTRINNVVHRGLRGYADSIRLSMLSESVYFLVVICLLQECKVPADALCRVQKHQRFRRLAHQLSSRALSDS